MRTTLTLDEDVALLVREEMERSWLTFKQVVNLMLRRGLRSERGPSAEPYRVKPHAFRARPGVDLDKLSQLADELEDEALLGRLMQES